MTPRPGRPPIVVTILLFEGCDAMDVVGPYEVVLTASRLVVRAGKPPPLEVVTASIDGGAVMAYGGMGLVPSGGALASCEHDVLVVPGLIDLDAALGDEALVAAVAAASRAAAVTASVCTGAFLLHAAGVLADRPATTHFDDVGLLAARRGPTARTRSDVRWVDDGSVVTSGGLSSGIAMALHLVGRLVGPDLADATARQLDYVWTDRRDEPTGGGAPALG